MQEENYNVFSNTTSANNRKKGAHMSLEDPHNGIHLSLGQDNDKSESGAAGDMAANETAGFDPIFFVHHSNIGNVVIL